MWAKVGWKSNFALSTMYMMMPGSRGSLHDFLREIQPTYHETTHIVVCVEFNIILMVGHGGGGDKEDTDILV